MKYITLFYVVNLGVPVKINGNGKEVLHHSKITR